MSHGSWPWVILQLWVCGQVYLSTLRPWAQATNPGPETSCLAPTGSLKNPSLLHSRGAGRESKSNGRLVSRACPHQGRNPARINSLPPGKASARLPQHCGHQRTVFFLRCGFWKWPPEVWQTTEFLEERGQGGDASLQGGYESRAGCSCMGIVLQQHQWMLSVHLHGAKLQPGVKSSHRNVHPKGDHWDKFQNAGSIVQWLILFLKPLHRCSPLLEHANSLPYQSPASASCLCSYSLSSISSQYRFFYRGSLSLHMRAKWLQLCLTLCDPMDRGLPGSSVHRIFQARIAQQVAISFSRGSSRHRDQTCVSFISCIGRRVLHH